MLCDFRLSVQWELRRVLLAMKENSCIMTKLRKAVAPFCPNKCEAEQYRQKIKSSLYSVEFMVGKKSTNPEQAGNKGI